MALRAVAQLEEQGVFSTKANTNVLEAFAELFFLLLVNVKWCLYLQPSNLLSRENRVMFSYADFLTAVAEAVIP